MDPVLERQGRRGRAGALRRRRHVYLADGCSGSGGLIRGKEALRGYWSHALSRNLDLRFELLGTYVGVDTIVINFRQQTGVVATEVLVFDGPLVVSGHAAHLAD